MGPVGLAETYSTLTLAPAPTVLSPKASPALRMTGSTPAQSVRVQAEIDEAGAGGRRFVDLGAGAQALGDGGGEFRRRLLRGAGGDHGGVGCHVAVGGIARGRDLHTVRHVLRQIRHGGVESIEHLGTDGLEQVGHEGCDAGNGAAVQGRSGERTGAGAVLPGANGSRLKST